MAERSGTTAVSGNDQQEPRDTNSGPFSFLTKFNFPNPFVNLDRRPPSDTPATDLPKADVVVETEKEVHVPNTVVVRFPNPGPAVPPPIEVEVEESSGKTHNPVVIWQVYALGGFIILKWVWARWNERKERAKKGSSSSSTEEAEARSPDYMSPTEGEE